jgi:type I restriction enzyme S subunit
MSDFFLAYANQCSYGVKMPRLGTTDGKKALFALPPLQEQKRIAYTATRAIETIEIIDNEGESLLDSVASMKSKILSLAIKGKLVPQDPTDEPASVLLERIRTEREALIKAGKIKRNKNESTITRSSDNCYYEKIDEKTVCIDEQIPFDLPKGWIWTRLGTIISVSSGDGLTSKQMVSNGVIPVYGGNGITGYHNESNVTGPILVIGRVGFYCGSTHIVDSEAWITDNAFIVTLMHKQISLLWLKYILDFFDIRNKSSSTAQPVISGKSLYSILVPIPPLQEQKRIAIAIKRVFCQLAEIAENFN